MTPEPVTTERETCLLVWTDDLTSRFITLIDKWRGLLLMSGWHIDVSFSESPDAESPETTAADIGTNGAYQSGHHICVYPLILKFDLDEQERKVIHELAHIITNPVKELARELMRDRVVTLRELTNENERATDWIANIVFAMHDDGKGKGDPRDG